MKFLKPWLLKRSLINVPTNNIPQSIKLAFLHGISNSKKSRATDFVDWRGEKLSPESFEQAVEFVIPWKFILPREGNGSAYETMADFSDSLADYIRLNGRSVIPRVNFGSWLNLPKKITDHRISWHSRGTHDKHLHLKIGTLPGYISIDSKGFSGWSHFSQLEEFDSKNPEEVLQHTNLLRSDILVQKKSKYWQPSDFTNHNEKAYVFFAMQIVDDVVSELSKISTLDLLEAIAQLSENLSLRVLIKRHPRCSSKKVARLIDSLSQHPNIKFVNDNIHDLIQGAQKVITVNSGVGAEALLHRKHVITTGRSDYIYATTNVSTIAELREALTSEKPPGLEQKIDHFLYTYTTQYMVNASDKNALQRHEVLNSFLMKT